MSEISLCDAIRSRCAEILEDLLIEYSVRASPGQGQNKEPTIKKGKVRIVDGFLPPKQADRTADDDFPFLIVRPMDGETAQYNSSKVSVKLYICCTNEKIDGFKYPMLILDRLRIGFMQKPLLDDRFRFEFPLSWEMPEDQPYPSWMLEVITEWTIPTPQDTSVEGII